MAVEGTESALLLLPLPSASLLGLVPNPKLREVLTQSVIAPLSGVPWLSAPLSDDKQLINSLITGLDRPPVPLVVARLSLFAVCFLTATAEAVMLPAATSAIAVTMATIANVVVLFAYIVIDIHTYLL
jgi:hypothetical protein